MVGGAAALRRLRFGVMELRARGRRITVDWLVPLIVLGIGVVNVVHRPDSAAYPGPPAAHVAFLAACVAALGLRSRAPLAAPVAALVVVTWWSLQLYPAGAQGPFEGFVVIVGAAYCIGTLPDRRRRVIGIAALVAAYLVGQVVLLAAGGRDGNLLPIAVWVAVAVGVGHVISKRTEQARLARQAAAVLAADQERQKVRAIEDERARIARELHDVVAHGLSVIVVQAGAERRALHAGPPDPQSLDAALGSIEHAGREALVDLRRLLGLLRRTDDPAALAPQPGLSQLDDLMDPLRATGIQVEYRTAGATRSLPHGLDLTVYRIVQEALTNVLKHANAKRVDVGVTVSRQHVDIEVRDDGDGRAASAIAATGAGLGLIGMRERVSVFGGTLSAGPGDGGGWSVRSRLPLAMAGVE